MSPPDHRRSSPELVRTLSDLYPTALASDPSELSDQASSLFTQHARAHERSLATHIATAGRLNDAEDAVRETRQKLEGLEEAVVGGLNGLRETVTAGFASVNLERTVERTKQRTTLAVLAVVWTGLSGLGGVAWHYLSQPSCPPDEALYAGHCVKITVQMGAR